MSTTQYPVGEALGFSPDDVIPSITGKIKSLYDPDTREGKHGEYSIQNATLETEHGEIKLTLFNNNLPKTARGRTVTIKAGKDKAKKLGGVNYEINEYFSKKKNEDVSEEVIKIGALASIEYEGGAQSSPSSQTQKADAPRESRIVYANDPSDVIEKTIMVHKQIDTAVRSIHKGVDEETIRCYVNSIFIQCDRNGSISLMVSKMLEGMKQAAESQEAPADDAKDVDYGDEEDGWASVIVPSGTHKGKPLVKVPKKDILAFYEFQKSKKSKSDFSRAVAQAVIDLGLTKDDEDEDQIPM